MQIHSVEYMESCAPVVAICNFCQMPYYQQMLSRLEFFLAAHDNPAKTCKGELCDFCQQEWITTLYKTVGTGTKLFLWQILFMYNY